MLKNIARFTLILTALAVMSCSPKNSSVGGSISVKSELAELNPSGLPISARALTTSDIQYIESEITLSPEQRAALIEVSQ